MICTKSGDRKSAKFFLHQKFCLFLLYYITEKKKSYNYSKKLSRYKKLAMSKWMGKWLVNIRF